MFIFGNSLRTLIIFIIGLSLFFFGRRKYYSVFMFYICVILLFALGIISFFSSSFYKSNVGLFFIAFPFIGESFKSGLKHIKNAIYCSKNITAKYIGSIKLKNMSQNNLYFMVFRYSYNSETYEQKTQTKYQKNWILDNYKTNQNYDIYINPQIPQMIITNRLSEFLEGFIVILISILLLILPIISLSTMLMMLNK